MTDNAWITWTQFKTLRDAADTLRALAWKRDLNGFADLQAVACEVDRVARRLSEFGISQKDEP